VNKVYYGELPNNIRIQAVHQNSCQAAIPDKFAGAVRYGFSWAIPNWQSYPTLLSVRSNMLKYEKYVPVFKLAVSLSTLSQPNFF